MEIMLEKWGPHGTIFFYAVINLVGCIFNLTALKETKGLSDADKKLIYSPLTSVRGQEQKINNFKSDAIEFHTRLGADKKFGGQGKMICDR